MSKRKYTKTLRAEQQDETRNRIVEAMVALHQELGPAKTSVKAIADKAGVQRLTVYRHFPDEASMLQACTAHYLELHPPPDLTTWADIEGPLNRSSTALLAFYKYYGQTQQMWDAAYRDLGQVEALQPPMEQFEAYIDHIVQGLVNDWDLKASIKKQIHLTLRHALRFSTWQSFEKLGLTEQKKTALVESWLNSIVN